MSFASRLRKARKQANLTQAELASKCGLATGTIQQYELGKRTPTGKNLSKIAITLNCGYSYTNDGEPYFYKFVDTQPDPQYKENELFNESQLVDAIGLKKQLILNFDSMNTEGQQKLVDYSNDILNNYKATGNTAQPDDSKTDTDPNT